MWTTNSVTRHLLAALVLLGLSATPSLADTLSPPSGPVILTVDGAITNTNSDGAAQFDRAMLGAFKQHTLSTGNPFESGLQTYQGPLLRDLLASVGGNGSVLIAEALDGYSIEIPIGDADDYDMLLATTWNGIVMTVRDKGPIWIVYPVDQHEELADEVYSGRSIWQLAKLTVQ